MKPITPVVIATCALAVPLATEELKSGHEDAGLAIAVNEHSPYMAEDRRHIPILLRPLPASSFAFELLDAPNHVENPSVMSSEVHWIMLEDSDVLTF